MVDRLQYGLETYLGRKEQGYLKFRMEEDYETKNKGSS